MSNSKFFKLTQKVKPYKTVYLCTDPSKITYMADYEVRRDNGTNVYKVSVFYTGSPKLTLTSDEFDLKDLQMFVTKIKVEMKREGVL